MGRKGRARALLSAISTRLEGLGEISCRWHVSLQFQGLKCRADKACLMACRLLVNAADP